MVKILLFRWFVHKPYTLPGPLTRLPNTIHWGYSNTQREPSALCLSSLSAPPFVYNCMRLTASVLQLMLTRLNTNLFKTPITLFFCAMWWLEADNVFILCLGAQLGRLKTLLTWDRWKRNPTLLQSLKHKPKHTNTFYSCVLSCRDLLFRAMLPLIYNECNSSPTHLFALCVMKSHKETLSHFWDDPLKADCKSRA